MEKNKIIFFYLLQYSFQFNHFFPLLIIIILYLTLYYKKIYMRLIIENNKYALDSKSKYVSNVFK